jgi:hypothetical protein
MIQITFERTSLPLGPYIMMAYFPRGRERLTTQAVVRHTKVPINGPRTLTPLPIVRNDGRCQKFALEDRGAQNLWVQGPPTQ